MKSITHTEQCAQLPAHPQVCNEEVLKLNKNSLHFQEQMKSTLYFKDYHCHQNLHSSVQTRSKYNHRKCRLSVKKCVDFVTPGAINCLIPVNTGQSGHCCSHPPDGAGCVPLAAGITAAWHVPVFYLNTYRDKTWRSLWTGDIFPPPCFMGPMYFIIPVLIRLMNLEGFMRKQGCKNLGELSTWIIEKSNIQLILSFVDKIV